MQQIKRRRDAHAWGELLKRCASSGLSVSAFCAREEISEASLYRWRSILHAGGSKQEKPRATALSDVHSSAQFVDLGALRSGSSRVELRLDLGGGVWLQLVRG
jgi:hypothetical protein